MNLYLSFLINAIFFFFFSSRRRHTRFDCDWSSDVCSSDLSSGNPETPVTDGGDMNAVANPGRVAGLWYLLLVLGGPLRLIYIPNKLSVHGDAAATAANIAAHPWLFRFGMASDLLGAVVLIFLVLAFYRLFKGVDQQLAVLLVITGGVIPALINFVNVVTDAGALSD